MAGCLLACSRPMVLLRPLGGPETTQAAPNRSPRGPRKGSHERPRALQERPRRAQDAMVEPPRGELE
eukprot:9491783-Pyramimonas_sp.AAC.1